MVHKSLKMKKLLYIGNKLSGHGFTITTIESLGVLLENEGYTVYYASSKKNKLLRMLDMLVQTIRKAPQTDYVIIDTYATQNFWYALLVSQLCRLLNLKYIPILHGGNLPDRLKRDPRYCRLIFANAYINVAPSNYFYTIFKNAGFDNTVTIPNIIETKNYEFTNRIVRKPRLLWVRSLAQIYNPAMAIHVLAELKKDFPNAVLSMVGPDKENLLPGLKAVAANLNVDVEFTGRLSKPEWIAMSKQYDIFINTTTVDNTPVSVIEAMALGMPVISTNVAGIPYLVQDGYNALLVESGNVSQMVNAVKRLISEPGLTHQLTQNAHALVMTFDWEVVKRKWLQILN